MRVFSVESYHRAPVIPQTHHVADTETGTRTGQRFFISMGVGRYRFASALRRPGEDAELMATLLGEFGYHPAPFRFGDYSNAGHVRDVLGNWCADTTLGPEDMVVLYFAGHGVVEEADRHYLLCWDSDPHSLAATALATEDIVRILTRNGLGHLLVVLDTCYGGDGAVDGAQLVLRTVARGISGSTTRGGVWFLSAARSEGAADGAFALTIRRALQRVGERTGQRQRFLDLTDIVTELNHSFERLELPQRAALANGLITGVAPFFANAGYAPHLPEGDTDLEQQRRLAKRDLDEHFDPRSRGVAYPTEIGAYFHGRERLRAELVDWILAEGGDGKTRVVTGSPGCGKSAVLGRIVAMADADYRAREPTAVFGPEARIPVGWVDVAVHARHKGLEQIVAQIADTLGIRADGSADLLRKLGERSRRTGKLVVAVDALDEAGSGTAADAGGRGEPRRIARQFLRPLAEVPNVRLLVGTRRELLDSLGSARVLDLDHERYRNSKDIPEYVANVLLAQRQAEIGTPYRDAPELARLVGDAVAQRAAGNFLVARMAARTLRSAEKPVDTALPNWRDGLPSGIGEAFEDDLDRFGPDKDRAKHLLTPLAFAEGQGLPRGPLWTGIAAALFCREFDEDDLAWLLKTAGSYLVEGTEGGRSVYRLYHLALAEYLRDTVSCGKAAAQRHIVDVLVGTVPRRADETPDWFAAHDYVHRHLATHAAASEKLDDLATDPGFLLAAEQRAMLRAFPAVATVTGRQARVAYEQVVHHLADPIPLGERAAYLELSARRCGATDLANRIDGLLLSMPWRTSWARWSPSGVHRQLVGHTKAVYAVATGDLDGRPVAVTGAADGTARIWDLIEHRQLGSPLQHDTDAVTAVALGATREYSIGVTGDDDGRLHVWDLSTGQRLQEPLGGHTHSINDIALHELDDRTIAASASADGTVRVWDLASGSQLGDPLAGHRGAVTAVAVGQLDGKLILVTGGADNRIRLWDLDTHEQLGDPLTGHAEQINSVALGSLHGRPVVVSASQDETMGVWDLATRHLVGEPVYAHWLGVKAVATGAIGSEAIAVTSGQESAKVWNLRTRQQIGQPLSGHNEVIGAVAMTIVEGRPIAITAGYDTTVRVWDLTADQPLSGHTRDVLSIDAGVVGGRALALTGSEDTTAIVWDLDNKGLQLGQPLTGHEAAVSAVALAELRGTPVAITGSEDTTVRIWDLQRRRAVGPPLSAHTGRITALVPFRLDGVHLLATGSQDGTVRVWRLEDGREYCPPLLGHNANVDLLAVGRFEGRTLVVGATEQGRSSAWSLPSGQPFQLGMTYSEHSGAHAVGFTRGRPIALIAGRDNAVQVWDLTSGAPMGEPFVGHSSMVRRGALDASDDHPTAVTGDFEGVVRIWDLHEGRLLGIPLAGHDGDLNALTFVNNGGRRSLLSAKGGLVRLWSLDGFYQKGEALTGYQVGATGLAFADLNGQRVVLSGGPDGMLRLHALSTGQLAGPILNGHRGFVYKVACVDDRGMLAVSAGSDRTLRVWDLATQRQRTRLDLPMWPYALAVDGRSDGIVAAVGVGSNVQVWSLASRALLAELDGHTAGIREAVISRMDDIPVLLTGSSDSTARLWNLETLQPIGAPWKGHDGDVEGVALADIDGRLVGFTGDDEGVVRMWDARHGHPLPCTIPKAERWISTLTAGRMYNWHVLAVGSADGMCRLFCLDSSRTVAQLHLVAGVNDIIFTEDGQLFVATGMGIVATKVELWNA